MDGVLPEMAARVSLLQKALDPDQMKEPPKKVLPASAITERNGGKVAFLVENGKTHMIPVVLGAQMGTDAYELKEGPAPGTRVVKDPGPMLSDGQSVKEKGGDG